MKTIFAGLAALLPCVAFADVNMRDASFLKTENDFSLDLMARTYNSRSLWKGIFGFGWCASFEVRFTPHTLKEGKLQTCDRSRNVSAQFVANEWKVSKNSEETWVFNLAGQWIRLEKNHSESLFLSYDSRGLVKSIRGQFGIIEFDYKLTGELEQIRQSDSHWSRYRFKDENLLSVTDSSRMTTFYRYDDLHNLVEIETPKGKERILYDQGKDEVKAYFSIDGCFEIYRFLKQSALRLKSSVFRRCPETQLEKRILSFSSKRSPQGELLLMEIKTAGGVIESSSLP
ncbi:MAG: hypothetical protein ACAH59_07745 [Pseudobdellovibrionaceae bacterium]